MFQQHKLRHRSARAARLSHRSGVPQQRAQRAITRAVAPAVDAPIKTGLVLGVGEKGSWDETTVGTPVVRCFVSDNEQRWFMWYSGRSPAVEVTNPVVPSTGCIGVAYSSDGINWQRGTGAIAGSRGPEAALDAGMVMEPSASSGDWWTLDTCHVAVSDVQVFSNASVSGGVGVYWMFYTGGDFEAVPVPAGMPGAAGRQELEGLRMRPGLAMSQDGRNWARIEAEHHTHALFDVGAATDWDALYVGHPKVLAAGPRDMRMTYSSYDASRGRHCIGLARSPDGFRWTRKGVVFDGSTDPAAHDALGATSAHVVRDIDSKRYFMFYEAVAADNTRSIGLAVSKDGLSNWQRLPRPLLAPAGDEAAWDGGSVGEPYAVSMSGGRWRLYYSGRRLDEAAWSGIGLALSDAEGDLFEGAPQAFKRRQAAA